MIILLEPPSIVPDHTAAVATVLVAQLEAVGFPIILFQFNFVLQTVLVAQHKAIVVPFQFEFAVPASVKQVLNINTMISSLFSMCNVTMVKSIKCRIRLLARNIMQWPKWSPASTSPMKSWHWWNYRHRVLQWCIPIGRQLEFRRNHNISSIVFSKPL